MHAHNDYIHENQTALFIIHVVNTLAHSDTEVRMYMYNVLYIILYMRVVHVHVCQTFQKEF